MCCYFCVFFFFCFFSVHAFARSLARSFVCSFTFWFFFFGLFCFSTYRRAKQARHTDDDDDDDGVRYVGMCVCMYEFVCLCAPCTRIAVLHAYGWLLLLLLEQFFIRSLDPTDKYAAQYKYICTKLREREKKRKPIHQINSTMKFFVFNIRSDERCVWWIVCCQWRNATAAIAHKVSSSIWSDRRTVVHSLHRSTHILCVFVPVSRLVLVLCESKSNG